MCKRKVLLLVPCKWNLTEYYTYLLQWTILVPHVDYYIILSCPYSSTQPELINAGTAILIL